MAISVAPMNRKVIEGIREVFVWADGAVSLTTAAPGFVTCDVNMSLTPDGMDNRFYGFSKQEADVLVNVVQAMTGFRFKDTYSNEHVTRYVRTREPYEALPLMPQTMGILPLTANNLLAVKTVSLFNGTLCLLTTQQYVSLGSERLVRETISFSMATAAFMAHLVGAFQGLLYRYLAHGRVWNQTGELHRDANVSWEKDAVQTA